MTVLAAVWCAPLGAVSSPVGDDFVYVGTYTGGTSKGIYRCRFNAESGTLTTPELVSELANPSFLDIHPNRRFLYAVCETSQFEGKPGGSVHAYSIAPTTGALTALGAVPSGGSGPCHLAVDKTGTHVLVANYNDGTVTVLPIQKDGRLGVATCCVKHAPEAASPVLMKKPHAHSVTFADDDRFVLVCDLGLDKVMVYRFDPVRGLMTANEPPFVAMTPGQGPRHLVLHPSGKIAYVANEKGNSVTVLQVDVQSCRLAVLQTLSTLPAGYAGKSDVSEIQINSAGSVLYAANRGHDSIAIYSIDPVKGTLSLLAIPTCGGSCPRHFTLDPSGRWLVVGNQHSDAISVFHVDRKTGALCQNGSSVTVAKPVCMTFLSSSTATVR